MQQSQKKLYSIICTAFIIYFVFQVKAEAGEFLPLDTIAISTGGAGVASASSSFGTYYNPALLSHHQSGFEWVTSVGVGIREFNLADHIDQLSEIKIDKTLDQIENAATNYNIWTGVTSFDIGTKSNKINSGSLPNDVKIIKKALISISDNNGLQIMPNVSIGFQFGNFGIGLFSISELTAVSIIDKDRLGFIVPVSQIMNSTSPGTGINFTETKYVQYNENDDTLEIIGNDAYKASSLQYALDNDSTYLQLRGITYYEIPVAYAQKFNTPLGSLSLGGSIKFMPGYTYEKKVKVDTESGDIQDEFDDGSEHQDTTFGIDLGFLYNPSFFNDRLVTGLVMKNINSPKFETKSGGELTIDPQIRAGMLYHLWRDTLMLSLDYDFSENESLLDKYVSQNLGGGIHFKPSHSLSLRCGIQQNMKSTDMSDEGTIFTAGLALGLKWVKLDLAGQYSTETTEFDGNEIPSSARVQLSLVSNLFYGKAEQKDSQYQDVDQRDVVQDAIEMDEETEDIQQELADEQVVEQPSTDEMAEEETPEEETPEEETPEEEDSKEEISEDMPQEAVSQIASSESQMTPTVEPSEEAPAEITEPLTITKTVAPTEKAEPSIMTQSVDKELPEKPTPCPTNNIQSKMQETINITTAISNWGKSWSSMNINAYLDMYSPNYIPSKGLDIKAWKKQRRNRLKKDFIKLDISNVSIEFTACDKAKVTFDQDYASPGYKDHTQKIMLFEKLDSRWLIIREGAAK